MGEETEKHGGEKQHELGQSPFLGAGGARYQCAMVTGILLILTCSQVCLFVFPDGLSINTQTHTPMHTHFLCI